ncbi:hypothetical protein JOC86_000366 [Bacillus pakistanensis]|uniref:Rv2525c-like glycoside hydrolase-like domain-containing protein n=1 Tax=Rossellomorea pakistanensis TaxID=992288 RepID=A0ABS2N7N6_9BACI|nr:glycoside hydrolase domain-containing protein [Bacillus pakistanensis]MBM7583829.1 hypothetical protein [Bacillus pakistanensis]
MFQKKPLIMLLVPLLVLLSLISGFLIYKGGFQDCQSLLIEKKAHTQQSHNGITPKGTNNIQNNVDNQGSSSAENTINNSVDHNTGENGSNNITNNIINNVEVNVNGNGNVKNSISNNISNLDEANKQNSAGTNESNDKSSDNGKKEEKKQNEIVWGIDTASKTNEGFYNCVNENFGSPQVVGRYLGTKEDVSKGITIEEKEAIKSKGAHILLIHNRFNDATGYENGVEEAKEAISLAEELGVTEGVALFADIEPIYPVNKEFILGWYETVSSSKYEPGIYGIFEKDNPLYNAFNNAVNSNPSLKENLILWTSAPNTGITTEEQSPEYQPTAPEGSQVIGWQYGIGSKTCNIDTNLFNMKFQDMLW